MLLLAVATTVACHEAPPPPAPPALDGAALFIENGCAACHGREGHGDGPSGRGAAFRPRDLANTASYRRGTSAAAIASTIATGVEGDGGGMPAFAHIPAGEREAIARYIVSLQKKEKPQ
jgi:mono/diheme cytochrome c family protein